MANNFDSLDRVLNRLHAMKTAKIIKLGDIAKDIGEKEQQVSQWVMQRTRRPRGDVAIKLHSFASKMSLRIALHRPMQVKYRAAYQSACLLFPDGRDER